MLRFLIRRALLLLFVVWGISLATFVLARLVPSDPARLIAGPRAGPEAVAVVRHDYGLDRPVPEQYVRYIGGLLQGDLGRSFSSKRPVADDLRAFLPATVELGMASLLLAVLVGVPFGIIAAVRRNSAADYAGRGLATLGLSLPPFWIGLLAQLVFYSGLTLLPVGGRLSQDVAPPPAITGMYTVDSLLMGQGWTFLDALRHLILPAIVLSFGTMAVFVRLVRTTLLEVMGQDYVRTARAKGLAERAVVVGHALRNALLPVLTIGALQLGLLLSGVLLIESIFSWPGIGRYTAQAIVSSDYNGIMGVTIVLALIYLLINTAVDLLYVWLDPRIKYS
ncbi:MAG TPA: ABC transporter permease [Roseiflexaceae bacterium]|nr:ABC transporter permease [Roseiflexaceae bacterium]